MPRLKLQLLGTFAAQRDGASITDFGLDSARALLAYLVLNPQIHRRETIATLFWEDRSTDSALKQLRLTLNKLRAALDDNTLIYSDSRTLQFDPQADVSLDAAEFDALVTSAAEHSHRRRLGCRSCLEKMKNAAQLYRGELLAGITLDSQSFEEWLRGERERYHQQALEVLYELAEASAERSEWSQADALARRQLKLEPWREEAHYQLIRAHGARGNRTAALSQYRECVRVLRAELGADPSPRTRVLVEGLDADGDKFARKRSALRLPSTEFFGRTAEISQLLGWLNSPPAQLISLVGSGGVGKTRLARQIAYEAQYNFEEGAYFVRLGDAADHPNVTALGEAIAAELGLTPDARRPLETQLVNALEPRDLLLVLDNFEPWLNTAAEPALKFIVTLLEQAPRVVLLITSREPLKLQAERVLRLDGLDVPPLASGGWLSRTYPSVELFIERAEHTSSLPLEAEQLEAVARICQQVEGIPLGIELAAALVKWQTPQEIARALARDLDVLTTGQHDRPERHRSIRAIFNYSWNLLSPAEQIGLAQISVFQGGFSESAAEEILGYGVLREYKGQILRSLVDKSLLRRQSNSTRYSLHPLARQFAAEKLAAYPEAAQTMTRHSAYYCHVLQGAALLLKRAPQLQTLQALQQDRDNFIAAWNWAVEHTANESLAAALEGLYLFYDMQGHVQEGADLFGAAVSQLKQKERVPVELLGRLTTRQGHFYVRMTQSERARALLEASATLGKPRSPAQGEPLLWYDMGLLFLDQSDIVQARQFLARALAEYRLAADDWGVVRTMILLSFAAMRVNDLDAAREWANQALVHQRVIGGPWELASALHTLGTVENACGDYVAASVLFRECRTLREQLGDRLGLASTLNNLGDIAYRRGEYSEAREWYQQTRSIGQQFNNHEIMVTALQGIGMVAARLGDYAQAIQTRLEYVSLLSGLNDRFLLDCDLIFQAELLRLQGKPARALELVAPFLDEPKTDPWLRTEAHEIRRLIENPNREN